MKILYIHQYFSTPKGSTGTRSFEMAKSLVQSGHDVSMVCGSYESNKLDFVQKTHSFYMYGEIEGIKVYQVNIPYSNHMSFFMRVKSFLAFVYYSSLLVWKLDYDTCFATSTPLTVAIPGIFSKILRRKKFILEIRDLWPELPKAMGVIKNPFIIFGIDVLETLAYKFSDKVIALSEGMKEGILKKTPKKEVVVIPNGSDLDLFDTSKSVKSECKVTSLSDDDFVCVFTGAHGIANGLDYVLDTATHLQNRNNKKIKFIFVGDGREKSRLVQRVKDENIKNCLFLDPMPKVELVEFLKFADVGLMILKDIPAFYNGTSPNKFFDYISAGLPVVNNYPGWLAEKITNSGCGIVVDPKDSNNMALELEKLSNDSELVNKMGVSSRKLAEKEFDRTNLAKKFVKFITS